MYMQYYKNPQGEIFRTNNSSISGRIMVEKYQEYNWLYLISAHNRTWIIHFFNAKEITEAEAFLEMI